MEAQHITGNFVQTSRFGHRHIEYPIIENTKIVFESLDQPWPLEDTDGTELSTALISANGGRTFAAAVTYRQPWASENTTTSTEVFATGPEGDSVEEAMVGLLCATSEVLNGVLSKKIDLRDGVKLGASGGKAAGWLREADI